jgi:hypothetical protein
MTLLSLFAMVLSLSRGCCAMRLVPSCGTEDMSLACRQLFFVHACSYAAFYPPPVHGLSQCGFSPASSESKDGLYTHIGGWPSIDEYGL